MNKKYRTLVPALITMLVLGSGVCGCKGRRADSASHAPAGPASAAQRLENGAYCVLRETPTRPEAQAAGARLIVLAYDRRKYSGAPPNEPLAYVALDPNDYVPLVIAGTPELKPDGEGKSVLTVSLARKNAQQAEAFTRAHLGGRIAMVVDGEIVSLHKIRTVITDGKVQITRCTDNVCEVLRSKLVN